MFTKLQLWALKQLLLLLANHVGDLRVLDEAVAIARRGIATEETK